MANRKKTDPRAPDAPAPLPDEAQRRAIREDLDTTILVEAAAGTGKTRSLVERMVALVATGKTTVDRLCAVTFTIRAAAHLKQRFQNALEEALREEKPSGRRERLAAALGSIDLCFTGTIHAFAARLLRERPVEAGIEPGFAEMDEPENGIARQEAWDRFVERLFIRGDARLARLIELGVRVNDLAESFADVCENSDLEPATELRVPEPDFSLARVQIAEFLDRAAASVPDIAPAGGRDPLEEVVLRARRLCELLDPARGADFVEVLRVLRAGGGARGAGPLKKQLGRLRQDVIKPALARWAEYLYPAVMPLLIEARGEYAAWRRKNGRANFQDLLLEARNLLRDHSGVRAALFQRFTPILVDEFQDTDPIQAEILFYLTGTDREEQDWRKLAPAAGSLFVVGDPKQSIYRFRRADIQTYQDVRRSIERCGRVIRLSTNFRSTPSLCDWINRTFARPAFFGGGPTALQAEYVPLVASKPETDSGPAVFRIETPGAGNADQPVIELDSVRIADFVAAQLAAGLRRPDDFLILFRQRRFMPHYARELEARGIAVDLGAGSAFGDSEDLASLMPILRALADPDDPVSLVAALRGPVFGIDDDALYRFARAGGRFHFRSTLPEPTDSRLRAAFDLFQEGDELIRTMPPAAAIARLLRRLGLAALAAAQPLGHNRAGTLVKALAAARNLSSQGMDFVAVVRGLDELGGQDAIEQMSIEPARAGAVRLLTIHGAKGLEAPVVILAAPTRDISKPRNVFVDRAASPPDAQFRVSRRTGDRGDEEIARPPHWQEMQEREEKFEEAEKARLLYVAATRAEDVLAVSVKRTKSRGAGGPWAGLDPYLEAELPQRERHAPAQTTDPVDPSRKDLEDFRALAVERRERAGRPGWRVTSVTAAAHLQQALPPRARTGRGMAWGRVLHGLLEAAMKDPSLDLRACAANLLVEEGRPGAEVDEAVRLVQAVRASSLWRRALDARQCLVEVPFALAEPPEQAPGQGAQSPSLWSGAIDLVFLEKDRWIVVDYKSDLIEDNRDALVDFYRPQLDHYRRFWERLTGTQTTAGLYFIQTGEQVWLE